MESKLLEKLIKDKTDFCVKVSNDDERNKLLSLFGNYKDIRWVSGSRPMEIKLYNYPYYIILRNGKTISYNWEKSNDAKEIKFNDLFDNNNYKQEIHITRKDNEVHAILKENGKVTKRTVAKCHPEDEFDFKVGSKLAYNRLFDEENEDIEVNKPKHEFKVGDKVRIRQWDDMVKEFGENCGIINVGTETFLYAMKYLCGKIAIIKATDANNYVRLEFKDNVDDTDGWGYTTDMIEPYTPRVAKVDEYVKILKTGKIVKCDHDTEYWGEKIFKCNEGDCIYLKPEEYEVLDDYIPPLNCRFVILEDTHGLTKGKIYEVKDGKFKDDDGNICPFCDADILRSENDLKTYFRKKEYYNGFPAHYIFSEVKYIIIKN